jgi:hypothetical protein
MTKTPEELTKDWKAGKLEYGRYWIKNKVWEKPFIDRWLPNCSWEISCKDAIEQVLAPVPTYDEYKAMQKELAELKEKIKKREELIQCLGSNIDELDVKKSVLIIENNKLRGLLKECVPYVTFKVNIEKNIGCTPSGAYLLIRIKDALGESEDDIERLYK